MLMEKAYEKYAWVVFLAMGLLFLVGALEAAFFPDKTAEMDYELFTDMTWSALKASSPEAADVISFEIVGVGLTMLGVAVFVTAISLTSYRRGERWAWYVMWYVPVFWGLAALVYIDLWGEALFFTLLTIVSLLGLLLPYRKFFPR